MPSERAMQVAQSVWSKSETKDIPINVKLATEFAIIIDNFIIRESKLIEGLKEAQDTITKFVTYAESLDW